MPKPPTENSIRRTDIGSPARLFFALLPDDATRERLLRLRKILEPAGGRPVPAESLHLTLLFLGEIAAERIEAVRDVAAEAEGIRCEIPLDTLGGFRQDETRVLWIGPAETPPALDALHRSLRRQVQEIGLRVKEAVYRPHVTLVRKASLQEKLPENPALDIRWTASRFALLASELLPSGARYRALVEKRLPAATR